MLITKEARRYDIACVNWPDDFPYAPKVSVELWHSGDCLHLRYKVQENAVRAVCGQDRENIWEDSCVEFFFMPEGSDKYYNVECNAVGKIYMACGKCRSDREFLPQEAYDAVVRRSSLGEEAFGIKEGPAEWEVSLDIPSRVFGLDSFDDKKGRGNFYNCGLPEKHFLSWAPIATEKPDFHRPEFFRDIEFER